ncbi:hypothetical protein ACGFZH_04295 [Streptomyces zaomyceticus]|uniref:hypothetical protein n=1 Tax=Streptomyces zaomyceticus TaxID=68286 RepID=UPI00371B6602
MTPADRVQNPSRRAGPLTISHHRRLPSQAASSAARASARCEWTGRSPAREASQTNASKSLNSIFDEICSPPTPHEGNQGRVTSTEAAVIALQDHAALWSIGVVRASEVVNAACDALVAGLDTPGLRVLAACTRAEADYDVHDLLATVLDELGLTLDRADSGAGQEAVARALARRMLAGEFTPRELTVQIHQRPGHGLLLTERLAELDDEYDTLEYNDRTLDQVDAEVTAEARRLAGHLTVPAGSADSPS